ncbi:hypothetical protein [Terrarubrum flagellatum]|uniref:hypothetical protein n=1 Tax=Terrirubrum flagellatum TaxID=2895980 RepID=UPI0031450358
MKRLFQILVIAAIACGGTLGWRWYVYVTNTQTPYDEVGIGLNGLMPQPLRKWGCDQLKKNFGRGLPPMGCSAGDGRQWM